MGQRILITHCWLSGFGGAELNILQLAKYLKENGDEVTIFTYWHEGELVDEFKKLGVRVVVDRFNYLDTKGNITYSDLNISNFDIIWVCQQVIPISIVNQLNKRENTKFIFLHMSSLIGIPVEAPIIYGLEELIASKILTISEETLYDNLGRIIDPQDSRISFYRNPVPEEFSIIKRESTTLQKIAVITNHPADELLQIEDVVKAEGIVIDYIGSWNNNYQLVNSDVVEKYDLIIGIGKNAQYCMVAGVPIYVYDYFGGPGFLNSKNYKKAQYYNFSGRGFAKKDSREIIKDILGNYSKALDFHTKNRKKWENEYSINKVADAVLSDLYYCNTSQILDDKYLNYIVSMQIMLHDRFLNWGVNKNNNEAIRLLESKLNTKNEEVEYLHRILGSRKRLLKRIIKQSFLK